MCQGPCSIAMLFSVFVIQPYACVTTLHFIGYLMKKIKTYQLQDVKYLYVKQSF